MIRLMAVFNVIFWPAYVAIFAISSACMVTMMAWPDLRDYLNDQLRLALRGRT